MQLKGKKINFLGDSITEGHGSSDIKYCFVSLIAQREDAICRTYGIGGTRIARQHKPSPVPVWDKDFVSRVDDMDPDADSIIVFGGTNDYGHGDAPVGEFSDRTNDTFCGALHCLYTKLLEKYPKADFLVLTPLHRLNEDNPRGDGNKAEATLPLSGYRDIIKTVAEYYSLPVLDLWAVSGLQPKVDVIREKFMPDGLHPSDAGYAILAERIGNFLLSL